MCVSLRLRVSVSVRARVCVTLRLSVCFIVCVSESECACVCVNLNAPPQYHMNRAVRLGDDVSPCLQLGGTAISQTSLVSVLVSVSCAGVCVAASELAPLCVCVCQRLTRC